jgi:hypothetical protein
MICSTSRAKTLIEHLIGLVEDQVFDLSQACVAAAGEIQKPARTRNDHIGCIAQPGELGAVAHATHENDRAECAIDLADDRGDLRGELTGRDKDEAASAVPAMPGEPLHHGDDEGQRFARPRRGLDDAIAPRQDRRNCIALDRVGSGVAGVAQRCGCARAHADVLECLCHAVTSEPARAGPCSPLCSLLLPVLEDPRSKKRREVHQGGMRCTGASLAAPYHKACSGTHSIEPRGSRGSVPQRCAELWNDCDHWTMLSGHGSSQR